MTRRGVLPSLVVAWFLCAAPAPAQIAAAPAQPEPAAPSVDDPEENPPALSVMIVETGPMLASLGEYVPEGAGPNFIPWSSFIEMRVQVLDHLWGRIHLRHGPMVYVAHALYIPGTRLLVISEPRRNARGFFARWYTGVDEHGEYCVPVAVVDNLGVRPAFRTARHSSGEDGGSLCLRE